MNWTVPVPFQFADFNGILISHQLLEDYLFAPVNSPGDGTVPGIVPPPPPPFQLEPNEAEEANEDLRPPVNAADVERVKRRLNF